MNPLVQSLAFTVWALFLRGKEIGKVKSYPTKTKQREEKEGYVYRVDFVYRSTNHKKTMWNVFLEL